MGKIGIELGEGAEVVIVSGKEDPHFPKAGLNPPAQFYLTDEKALGYKYEH